MGSGGNPSRLTAEEAERVKAAMAGASPTEDGYTGTLHLDHTTVKVTTDGCAIKTETVSAIRTYPNLSDVNHS